VGLKAEGTKDKNSVWSTAGATSGVACCGGGDDGDIWGELKAEGTLEENWEVCSAATGVA
jgi:hypothetical protein